MKDFQPLRIFSFLKYIQPVWYFNLKPHSDLPYWVDYRLLSTHEQSLISYDSGYKTEEASLRDAAYQAWHKGIISFDPSKRLVFESGITRIDEYRFTKKYFHSIWGVYVLLLRLITFHNPVLELMAFLKVSSVHRVNLYETINDRKEYEKSKSGLIKSKPLVSIVIPTLNRYKYLKDVLIDLENQDYHNFEVIIIDQTDNFQQEFYKDWRLNMSVMHQEEKALWMARNRAIAKANGEFILLYDDDSRVNPDWISEHLKCIDYFDADYSAGVSLSVIGSKVPVNYSFFRWTDQIDTGNVMIRKEVFRKIGLFDRQFEKQRMGDGEFGLRAYLAGFQGISNPKAKRIHLKVATGGLRQMGSWDGFRPTNWFAPRPIPSVLYFTRIYFGNSTAILNLLIKVPSSVVPLAYKRKPLLLLLGYIFSFCIFPLVFYQVLQSWKNSSQMIIKGPMIDFLEA